MVAVHDCGALAAFGRTVTVTFPLPEPDAGAMESAALADDAVHEDGEHPAGDAVTPTTCEPPPDAKLAEDGEIPNVHGLFVGVGCVGAGVLVGDDPLHPSITTRIREAASEHVSFMIDHDTRQPGWSKCSSWIGPAFIFS